MRMVPERRIVGLSERSRHVLPVTRIWACIAATFLCGIAVARVPALRAQAQPNPYTTWTVTIVLTPRLMAGHPATLAVFGVDRKLAAGVTVTLGNGQMLTTDRTGRAVFTVPCRAIICWQKARAPPSRRWLIPQLGRANLRKPLSPRLFPCAMVSGSAARDSAAMPMPIACGSTTSQLWCSRLHRNAS